MIGILQKTIYPFGSFRFLNHAEKSTFPTNGKVTQKFIYIKLVNLG